MNDELRFEGDKVPSQDSQKYWDPCGASTFANLATNSHCERRRDEPTNTHGNEAAYLADAVGVE